MPSQLIHLQICSDVIGGPEGLAGQFLLGAIAPDAWAVAGLTREATHFWDVTEDASSTARLRGTHPELGDPAALPPDLRAFVAGYLCHLVTDEQWTFTIYRPYFGRYSTFRASPEGGRTQLALQALMEQRLRDRRPAEVRRWLDTLAGTPAVISLPFLAAGAVGTWRDLLLEACRLPTMAEAFPHFLAQVARVRDTLPRAPVGAADDWPGLMRRAAAHVPETALETFQRGAGEACAAVLEAWSPRPPGAEP